MKRKKRNDPAPLRAKDQLDYYDHWEILRWKILRVLGVLAAASVACYFFIDPIVLLLKKPVSQSSVTLVFLRPYEKFLSYLKISFFSGIIVTVPYALIEAAAFLYPALRKNEKRTFILLCLVAPVIFFSGMLFAYQVIVPAAMNFFLNFASGDAVKPFWSIGEYFDLVLSLVMACAILFLIPLVLLFLIRIRVLSADALSRARGYIILAIAILAGVFSPPDVVSQILIGVPLYLLFELTVLIGRFV